MEVEVLNQDFAYLIPLSPCFMSLMFLVAESEISIVFIILSQNTDYDARKASRLYDSLKAQTLGITNLVKNCYFYKKQ